MGLVSQARVEGSYAYCHNDVKRIWRQSLNARAYSTGHRQCHNEN